MLSPRPAETGPIFLRRWGYRPSRSLKGGHPDGDLDFRRRLATALLAGHGVRAAFGLAIGSGPVGEITISTADPGSARWVVRALLPAYEAGNWVPNWGEPPELGRYAWSAVRIPVRSEAGPSPAGTARVSESVAVAFSVLPPGIRMAWTFVPSPFGRTTLWDPLPTVSPVRRPRPGVAARTAGEDTSPRVLLPAWTVQCGLTSLDAAVGRRASRAAESATRATPRGALRFRPARLASSPPRFACDHEELTEILPGPHGWEGEPADAPAAAGADPIPLGRTLGGRVVAVPAEPDQGRHIAVLGETGMGKSSLLAAIARRVAGRAGIILFDPIGDTARAVRRELAGSGSSRVTWLSPEGGLRLNALASARDESAGRGGARERTVNDLVHALRRVRAGRYTDSGYWGPRLEEMLTRALAAAAALPQGTLEDAHTLLSSGGRGFRVVPPEACDAVQQLAERIRARPDDADGARRLLFEVARSPTLLRTLCDREPTDRVRDLVAPGRTVLIAGDAESVGESTARYFLSVLLALVWAELLARPGTPKTFVLLDEAQWFGHESLAEMLRLGRRRNVHVVLATQSVGSLPPAVAEAVWTNVADFVAFRGSPEEAREFARTAPGVVSESILGLPRGEAAVLLGKGGRAVRIRTARIPPSRRAPSPLEEGGAHSIGPAAPNSRTALSREELGEGALEPLLAEWLNELATVGPAPVFRVSLNQLRRSRGVSDPAIRRAGAELARRGVLVGRGRDDHGAYWLVDRARLRRLTPTQDPLDPPPASSGPQPS